MTYAATLSDGVNLSALATFNIAAPAYEISALPGTITVVASSPYPYLQDGVIGFYGMNAGATITAPTGSSTQHYEWIQLVIALTAQAKLPGGLIKQCQATGLDTNLPYVLDGNLLDDPGFRLDGTQYIEESDSNSFADYLMWQPSGAASIFVPIATMSWGWSGDTTYNSSTGLWLNPPTGSHTGPSQAPATVFPIWSQNAATVLQACIEQVELRRTK